jgi:hypothetical protein
MWSNSGNDDFCSTSGVDYDTGLGYLSTSNCENEAPYNIDSAIYNQELGCEWVGVVAYPKCSPGY